jgi:nucleoside-triphosphatase THEP1
VQQLLFSPASPLANLFLGDVDGAPLPEAQERANGLTPRRNEGRSLGRLVILTGPRGSGKSTQCARLVEEARAGGRLVAGFIAHPVFTEDEKTAIELEELTTGQRRRLARRRRAGDEGLLSKQWYFEPDVMAWANQVLTELPRCDRLVLDELGPLELERGMGMQAALALVDERRIPLIWAVIRPALLPLALARWPWAEVQQSGVSKGGRF